ncbi:hypothetical protein [Brevundimonas sp.]|uniref:hypothetical protein n=1 Tax=Brevundimonas sp. TaxID=1871086 RepID=UPI002AB94C4C|nr:hypothetical protein [Brevundimonas sp.]MDZ4364035.1 hypothetical protein [Brevundimonas sp.]
MDDAVKAKLDALAASRQVTLDVVVAEAVTGLSQDDAAFLAAVDEGLAALDDGKRIPHDEIVADVMRRRADRNRAA